MNLIAGADSAAAIARVTWLVEAVQGGSMALDVALKDSALVKIQLALDRWRNMISAHRTARLWIQYQKMVEIL